MDIQHHAFSQLLLSRHSCRDFLPEAVPESVIKKMMVMARAAPSSANLQPGKFHVLAGEPLGHFVRTLSDISASNPPEPVSYSYFPQPMPSELKQRQREAGYALYGALNIQRRDIAARKQQFAANYRFFDAPVGMVVTIDKEMGSGCFMDLGMFIMSFLMLAESAGYSSCVIGALSHYGSAIHRVLSLSADEQVVCGIALGRANRHAAVNQFRTSRIALEDFVTFQGFSSRETQ